MQTTKGKKGSAKAQSEKTKDDHFQVFQATVNEFLKDSQEKVAELLKEFYGIVGDYQGEFQSSQEEEYRRMVATIQESLGQEKSNELIQKAQEQFTANLEEKKTFIEKGIEEARQKYTKTLEGVAEGNQKKYNDAYQKLIKALKSDISGINLKNVSSETLATLGQTLIHTSQFVPAD